MRYFIGFFICGLGMIFFQGCAGAPHVPPIDATFWAGDSSKDGISRSQENRTIECKAPQFDDYACLTYTDLQKIYSTLLQCKQWSVRTMNSKETMKFLLKNREVIENVIQRNKAAQSDTP